MPLVGIVLVESDGCCKNVYSFLLWQTEQMMLVCDVRLCRWVIKINAWVISLSIKIKEQIPSFPDTSRLNTVLPLLTFRHSFTTFKPNFLLTGRALWEQTQSCPTKNRGIFHSVAKAYGMSTSRCSLRWSPPLVCLRRLHSPLAYAYGTTQGLLRPEHSHATSDWNHWSNLYTVMQHLFKFFVPLYNLRTQTIDIQQWSVDQNKKSQSFKELALWCISFVYGSHDVKMWPAWWRREAFWIQSHWTRAIRGQFMDQALVFVTFAANRFRRPQPVTQYALKWWTCAFKGLEMEIQWNLGSF